MVSCVFVLVKMKTLRQGFRTQSSWQHIRLFQTLQRFLLERNKICFEPTNMAKYPITIDSIEDVRVEKQTTWITDAMRAVILLFVPCCILAGIIDPPLIGKVYGALSAMLMILFLADCCHPSKCILHFRCSKESMRVAMKGDFQARLVRWIILRMIRTRSQRCLYVRRIRQGRDGR